MSNSGNSSSGSSTFFAQVEAFGRHQEQQQKTSKTRYLKIAADESVVLTFDLSKAKVVERDDKFNVGKKRTQAEYTVMTEDGGEEKILGLSMFWAKTLNKLLQAGYTKIVVERQGEGLQTNYSFVPARQ
jgi:hypothetical protein